MGKLIIWLLLIFLIYGCVIQIQRQQPAESTSVEDIGLIYGDAYFVLQPKYHPGDFYALGQEIVLESKMITEALLLGILVGAPVVADYQIILHKSFWNECKNKCEKECEPEFTCENKPPLSEEYNSCKKKYEEVFRPCNARCSGTCLDEKYKSTSVARHRFGGNYTDGSYYEHSQNDFSYFNNVHPEKDKYEKTRWQKDRDECMALTYENEVKNSSLNGRNLVLTVMLITTKTV